MNMSAHFSPAALKFLKALTRNNDRDWFNARKETYEAELKAPMLAVIAEVNDALAGIAPQFVRDPAKCMMRIYRDIRFSPNKQPYKTNIAAWWARAGLEKTSGAGFYLELSPDALRIAAGAYMPEKAQLLAIRRMLLDDHEELRRFFSPKYLRGRMEPFDGQKMTRGPKGFPADHPALDLILHRQWGIMATLPTEIALSPNLGKEIASRFQLALPLVELLNRPVTAKPEHLCFSGFPEGSKAKTN